MKSTVSSLLIALALATPAFAQQKADEHDSHHAAAGTDASAADLTEAQVRRVDKEAAKLTLKHGEIRNLEMPPMTMVFSVRDKAVLDKLKAGDRIRFKAVNEAGQYIVTDIQLLP